MSPRVRMAIHRWQPAPDGAAWEAIRAAWETLYTLILEAARQDRSERS